MSEINVEKSYFNAMAYFQVVNDDLLLLIARLDVRVDGNDDIFVAVVLERLEDSI
jgi:hypothetical protein